MGFTGRIKLFGHRVPSKNDTDAGVFHGHQEDLFSRSPGLSLWVFFLYFFVWTEEDVHVGKNSKAHLPPLPFKKAKKLFKYWLTLTLISLQQLENKLTSEMLIQLIQ